MIMIMMILILVSSCSNDTVSTSPIDDVSDEVYEQLVQHYFFWSTQTDILLGDVEPKEGKKGSPDWFQEHELMEEAEEYVEEHDDIDNVLDVFPNPLMLEYAEDPDAFTETEQSYLDKMIEFFQAASRVSDDYEKLKEEWKDDLEIENSDNIFDVTYK